MAVFDFVAVGDFVSVLSKSQQLKNDPYVLF